LGHGINNRCGNIFGLQLFERGDQIKKALTQAWIADVRGQIGVNKSRLNDSDPNAIGFADF
jgi:hypothetical protein